jgi:hypothetical protein
MSRTALISLVVLALGACAGPAFKQPPAGSYVAESHLFKIGDTAASVPGASVTKDFFSGTDAQALLGRFFIDGDFLSVSPAVVVLSNQLWTARFGASQTIIGQAIEIDGRHWTVVGVAPNGFGVPPGAQFWLPKRP